MVSSPTRLRKKTILEEAAEGVDDWLPEEFADKKAKADTDIECYHKSLAALLRYKSSLELASQRNVATTQAISKKQRERRKVIENRISNGGCPSGYSKYIALLLEPRKGNGWGSGQIINNSPDSSTAKLSLADSHDFKLPAGIIKSCTPAPSPWKDLLEKARTDLDDQCKAKYQKAVDHMLESIDHPKHTEKTHVAAQLAAYKLHLKADGCDMFQYEETNDPIMVVQKNWSYTNRMEANPYAGMPSFLTCCDGLLWVTSLNIEFILNSGKNMATVHELLASMGPDAMDKQASFILSPGDSIWNPAGFMPVVIAIGPEIDRADSAYKYGSFTQFTVTDSGMVANMRPLVAIEVKSWLESGIAKKLRVFDKNGAGIRKWLDEFPKVVEAQKSEEDVD